MSTAKDMDAFIEENIKRGPTGCGVRLTQNGEVLYERYAGYADLEKKKPITEKSVFRQYSLTKVIVCTTLMMLYEKGKFLLQDPIYEYFPEWKNTMVAETNEDGSVKKQKLGNTIAPVTGGFGFNGTFLKNFDFNVFCNFSLNNKIVNGTKLALSYYRDSAKKYNLNEDFSVGNRYTWIDPETGMNLGRPHNSTIAYYKTEDGLAKRLNEINANAEYWNPCAATAMQLTDYAVEDASFLRLQQVTLGYSLSKNVLKKCFLSAVRFYVTGYNLYCWTKYTGNDPEVDTS
ncbi:MAG: serine hydrolase, partial [Lachnospiraceae bacterium]|nr:serine hydrolase [Lachnospiraceae bacterium]